MYKFIKKTILSAVAASLLLFNHVQGGTVFPITTNNTAKLTFGAAFDGTNYLVPIEGNGFFNRADTNRQIAVQFVSQSGTLVGSLIDVGRNATHSQANTPLPYAAFDGANYLVVWTDSGNSPNEDIYGQ